MADDWVELTAADERCIGQKIFVNLSHATSLWPVGDDKKDSKKNSARSQIWFSPSDDGSGHFRVTETPDEIIGKPRARFKSTSRI